MPNLVKKITVIICGVFFCLIVLELGIRAGGALVSFIQEQRNIASAKKSDSYRIMCLGESTTAGQYPRILEKILNQRNIGIRFSVIDKGVTGSNTAGLLVVLEENLNKYRPDMVITMMGCNDKDILYYQDIPDYSVGLFQYSRLYRFMRILYIHFLKKLRGYSSRDWLVSDISEESEVSGTVVRHELIRYKSLFSKAIRTDPKSDWAFFGLGWIYRSEGRFPEAQKLIKKAIELSPKNEEVYSKVCRQIGCLPDIEILLKEILKSNPGDEGAYTGLGFIYRVRGNISEAEAAFKKAIMLNPKNGWAYFGLGWVYRMEGKFPEAAQSVESSIELNPKNDWAYIILGEIYLGLKSSPDITKELFRKAVALNPQEDNWAYTRLGRYLSTDPETFLESEQSFKKGIEAMPNNERAYIGLGLLYQKYEKFTEAENIFKQAIKLYPDSDIAYKALNNLYNKIGVNEPAEQYGKKASKLVLSEYSPLTVASYHKLKEILDKRGIKLVCMQYPIRSVEPLKKIFAGQDGVIFVDNERIFQEAVARKNYWVYFRDMFAGDFGHCTNEGNRLLAENIADVILKEYFKR
jgi:tetratricopeptide (TPR) repeat protein